MSIASRIFLYALASGALIAGGFVPLLRDAFPSLLRDPARVRTVRWATFAVAVFLGLVDHVARSVAPVGGGAWLVPVFVGRVTLFVGAGAGLAYVGVRAVSRLLRWMTARVTRARTQVVPPEAPEDPDRRQWMRAAAAQLTFAAVATPVLRGAYQGFDALRVRDLTLAVPSLPPALEGFTIAQWSDVHVGLFTSPALLHALAARTASLRADAIVLTGDLLDFNPRHVPEAMEAFARLRARHGVHAILGNHDYYTGAADVLRGLRQAGVSALVNRHVTLAADARGAGLVLAGLDDLYAPRYRLGGGPNLAVALAGAHPESPRLVLSHNPKTFPSLARSADVVLAGHTHGGQIHIPGVTERLLPFVAGTYRLERATLSISNGLGFTGLPARIGAPPEIVRVALTRRV